MAQQRERLLRECHTWWEIYNTGGDEKIGHRATRLPTYFIGRI